MMEKVIMKIFSQKRKESYKNITMSSKTALLMTWPEHERPKNRCQRTSAYYLACKELDSRYL